MAATTGQEIARKITIATITGGATKWFGKLLARAKLDETTGQPTVNDSLPLMAVYGFATKASHGASDFGEWTKLHGNFRAVNLDTGEITNSGVVMLPPFVSGGLEGALEMEGAQAVQFAFEIHAIYDPTSLTKYSYKVLDRMPPSEANPLAALEAAIGIQPKLAAPTAPPALEAAQAAAAAPVAPAKAPTVAPRKR